MYNFTALTVGNNLAGLAMALTVQAATLAVMATFPVSFRRRRRDLQDEDDRATSVLIEMIADLDGLDCVAGVVCEASQQPKMSRSSTQDWLLQTLKVDGEEIVPYSLLSSSGGKFHYAAFFGHHNAADKWACQKSFPRCPLSFVEVLDQFTSAKLTNCHSQLMADWDEELMKSTRSPSDDNQDYDRNTIQNPQRQDSSPQLELLKASPVITVLNKSPKRIVNESL